MRSGSNVNVCLILQGKTTLDLALSRDDSPLIHVSSKGRTPGSFMSKSCSRVRKAWKRLQDTCLLRKNSLEFLASAAGAKACERLQLLPLGATGNLLATALLVHTCTLQLINPDHFEHSHCFPLTSTALQTIWICIRSQQDIYDAVRLKSNVTA